MLAQSGAKMSRTIIVAIVALLVLGCTTRRIIDHPIEVPAGLTDAEVEGAIKEALEGTRQLRGTPAFQYQTDPGFALASWSLEDPSPGYYTAVLRTSQYGGGPGPYAPKHRVLKVGIWYSAQALRTRIVSAGGLKFDGERVHKAALKWQAGLDRRLASELAWVAKRKHEGD